ncbi:hypothetical protein ACMFMG_000665 [Clarireedia jacksonii]
MDDRPIDWEKVSSEETSEPPVIDMPDLIHLYQTGRYFDVLKRNIRQSVSRTHMFLLHCSIHRLLHSSEPDLDDLITSKYQYGHFPAGLIILSVMKIEKIRCRSLALALCEAI